MQRKSNPAVYLARKLWEFSKGNRKSVVLYVSLFVVANIIHLLMPLVVGKALNMIQQTGLSFETLPKFALLLSALLFIPIGFWFFHGPARVIERTNAFLARANYKRHLLQGTMDMPIDWHVNHHSGDTIDKIEKGASALYRFSSSTFELIGPLAALGGSFIALTYFNVHSAYILVVLTALTAFIVAKFDDVLVRQYKVLNRSENQISERIYDALSNITTVVILRVERLVSNAIFQKIMEPFGLYRKNSKINEVKWFLVGTLNEAMVFLILFSYVYFGLKAGETILVGTVYALYGYVREINDTFFRFTYKYSDIVQQRTAVANAEETSSEFKARRRSYGRLHENWKELTIENLSFSYHTEVGSDLHLEGVSMRILRGERIALIGESGSGKTTFLKIIRELYTPQKGEIRLDGKVLPNGFADVSHDISLIPQDPEIFATTIRDNITVGVPHDDAYIKKFTDMARFSDIAERLPHGLDSSIVEKGVNLSGGEKQRLALARGLMASEDKTIILLDEPTSSVDSRNELEIYRNIFSASKDKTVISSIHRLHLLPLFDIVYLFSDGKIVASGSFEELKASSPEFREMWSRYERAKEYSLEDSAV